MRRLILQEFLSLDGLAAGPNDSVAFVPASTQGDRSFGQEQLALMDAIDTIVLGRHTYEMFSGYWPHVTEGEEKPFADKLNATRKVVFSKTLGRAPWGKWADVRIVADDPVREIPKLKTPPGKDLVIWGSISLAQSLMSGGFIDEYRLVFCPVVLGAGRPLFRDKVESLDMKLLNTRTFERGAVLLTYAPGDAH
jgi:dihydrofolate reductase